MQIKLFIILFHIVLVDQNILLACMQVLIHIWTFSLISAMMKFVLHKLITTMYELCQCMLADAGRSQHIYMLHSTISIRITARYDHQIPCPCMRTQHACLGLKKKVHYYSSLLVVGITEDGKSFWFWLVAPIQKLIAPQREKAHQDYLI